MKLRFTLPILLACLASIATAQDESPSLIERGAQMFMEGLLQEMEPALEGLSDLGPTLQGFVQEMGPALAELMEEVKDWSAYHPPEILPNGDIILRKKTPEASDGPTQDIEI